MNSTYILTSDGELYHYGVKGMKWGVRRYQNEDGSLTPRGKKRFAKEYDKRSKLTMRKLSKQGNRMYMNAYNKAADDMNRGGIEKFNVEQRRKYGDNYAERDNYINDYNAMFTNRVAKYFDISLNNFYKNDKNFQKCEQLVDKYKMDKWHDLAKKNTEVIKDLRRAIENNDHDSLKTAASSRKKTATDNLKKQLSSGGKDLDAPYAQEIAPGVHANWPTKRAYLEAEIKRIEQDDD